MDPIVLALAAAFGLVFGSFATVLTVRVPRDESIVSPGSHCRNCGRVLKWYENLPLLGFLLAGGRCRGCKQPIGWRYPLIEAMTALLFVGSVLAGGYTVWTLSLLGLAIVTMPLLLIDLDEKRLPNPLNLAAFVWGAICVVAAAVVKGGLDPVAAPLLCVLAGAGSFFLLNLLSRGGMGMGDVKLVGVLGIVLGLGSWRVFATGLALAFLIGGVVGIVLLISGRGGRKTQIPFGPYLLAGAWISVIAGPSLQDAVLRLWGL